MKKEKSIDDIFKNALQDPANEPAFKESDWDNFENMLDDGKRRGVIFWLPILGSVAAVLLAFFGWWLFRPQTGTTVQHTQQQVAINKLKTQAPAIKVQQQKATGSNQAETHITTNVKPANASANEKTTTQQTIQPQYLAGSKVNGGVPSKGKKQDFGAPSLNNGFSTVDTAAPYLAMVPINTDAIAIDHTSGPGTPVLAGQPKTGINTVAIASPKQTVKTTVSSTLRPQYALSVLAAPEINGVGSFNSTSSGTNVGLLFTVGLNKFSASTGATYSTKPYSMPFSNYHTAYQFKTDPQYVSADCRVLDIPINVGYQLYNKSSNKISIGTGLSSYIMMHESYTYDYGNDPYPGPTSYAVKKRGKYFFSIMNLQASYERKVAPNVGLSFTPYLKLPLSNIGYSQVKVQTFGVAVGLNWNINSITKPR